ncbi:hypothetical protein JYU34_011350 [Plutella xylostella]|uniref:Uncharacterized protein n=1 Tax=Plutella xylostella TaxID=51655 RepID=A0ABQ7QGR2_PLUXY|nr:hypothetical protein JYU34_011350 [Plutella xylostella]
MGRARNEDGRQPVDHQNNRVVAERRVAQSGPAAGALGRRATSQVPHVEKTCAFQRTLEYYVSADQKR